MSPLENPKKGLNLQSPSTLIIRTDVTTLMGTGHIMRCLALAQAWRDYGGHVVFLSHCESKPILKQIAFEGFEFIPVEEPYPNQADLRDTLHYLGTLRRENNDCWFVLDGYHFDTMYQKTIREEMFPLLVIDDGRSLSHYHADVLVNQNMGADKIKYECGPNTDLLLGVDYVMLRSEYLKFKGNMNEIYSKADKVLVTMGGGDTENLTTKILHVLRSIRFSDLRVKVVIGPLNSRMKNCGHLGDPQHFEFIQNAQNMPQLISWADIAIICAGGTLWECLYMGCPLMSFAISQIQHDILSTLHEKGAIYYLGWGNQVTEKKIAVALENICISPILRNRFRRRGRRLIDGKGVKRVIQTMIEIDGKRRKKI